MSNLVLYRKYRPKIFGEVINQEAIKTTLANAASNKRPGHAYLFTGPRGIGKTTLARIFARAVNCPNVKNDPPRLDRSEASRVETGEPCNTCPVCLEFLNGTSLDIIEIDAASHTGVDNIRELIEHLQFVPTRATYKVIIIDEVHMLSKGAFNALLKTLEEPPAHAIFILATTEVYKVPATIVSRTQRFDFKKVSIADILKLLRFVAKDNGQSVSNEALIEIAIAADGSFRDALSLFDQIISFAQGPISEELVDEVLGLTSVKTIAEFLELIIGSKTLQAVNFISDLVYKGTDLFQFQKDLMEYLRKLLLIKVGSQHDFGLTDETVANLNRQADSLNVERLIRIIELFNQAGSELKFSSVQTLPLELAVVEACGGQTVDNTDSDSELDRNQANKQSQKEIAISPLRAETRNDSGKTLENIKNHWPAILVKIKDYNHSLLSSLNLASPVEVIKNELVLLFPYKFHKDAIEARKNRIVVDQVIEEVTGIKLMVKPMLAKDWQAEGNKDKKGLVESALKIMGGEVEES